MLYLNYYLCKYTKVLKDQDNSLLKSLLIPFSLLIDIILDFIISLSLNNYYNVIFIVTNYLIKKKYYISYSTNENSIILINLLLNYYSKIFGNFIVFFYYLLQIKALSLF